jgi:hypothetical protein
MGWRIVAEVVGLLAARITVLLVLGLVLGRPYALAWLDDGTRECSVLLQP